MANNELSGILLSMSLIKFLKKSKYSIRILLIPETIGAINFIEKNLSHLKKNLIAGFNLTCIGDKGKFSIVKSVYENTYPDYLVKRIFDQKKTNYYSYLYRGSNERQFGCQNLDLPFVTISRTLYGKYKEYHTSEDNLNLLSESSLKKSLSKIIDLINEIQENEIYVKKINCEPFLTKYKLMKSTNFSPGKKEKFNTDISNFLAYVDKNKDLKVLSEILRIKKSKLNKIVRILRKNKIIEKFI
jgi:aminopeptidase-like protein